MVVADMVKFPNANTPWRCHLWYWHISDTVQRNCAGGT